MSHRTSNQPQCTLEQLISNCCEITDDHDIFRFVLSSQKAAADLNIAGNRKGGDESNRAACITRR